MATENKKENAGLSEEQISALVKAGAKRILDAQKSAKAWGKAEHIALISNLAADYDCTDKEQKREFRQILSFKGVGGNDSQFRQWLVKEGLMSKADAQPLDEYE
jgi:hypothetical protein